MFVEASVPLDYGVGHLSRSALSVHADRVVVLNKERMVVYL